MVLSNTYYVRALVAYTLHIPMQDAIVSAHAHATIQRALDIPAMLRKNAVSMQLR